MNDIFAQLIAKLSELKKLNLVALVFLLAVTVNIIADTGLVPSGYRLYHPGWVKSHMLLMLIPIFTATSSLWLARGNLGLLALFLICLGILIFLVKAYGNEKFESGYWPLIVWILYRVMLSLLVGILPNVVRVAMNTSKRK